MVRLGLGKNGKVNTLELEKDGDKPKISHKDIHVIVQPTITHKNLAQKRTITREKQSCLDAFSGLDLHKYGTLQQK